MSYPLPTMWCECVTPHKIYVNYSRPPAPWGPTWALIGGRNSLKCGRNSLFTLLSYQNVPNSGCFGVSKSVIWWVLTLLCSLREGETRDGGNSNMATPMYYVIKKSNMVAPMYHVIKKIQYGCAHVSRDQKKTNMAAPMYHVIKKNPIRLRQLNITSLFLGGNQDGAARGARLLSGK
ncbi:hypothetical protein J6590_081430 [Homalodisca vitripennis]|nr:hypothetical protein J6590_081430 [Homalodisca vitripennis]